MQKIVLVGFAGLFGTLLRFWTSSLIDQRSGSLFPVGTLAVNLIGCLLAGFLFQFAQSRQLADPVLLAMIFVGFLGGFTTFSSYALQTFNMVRNGNILQAGLNIAISNVAGLVCVWLGSVLSRSFT